MSSSRLQLQTPLHFLGIGGSGMTPLALLAAHRGYSVTGSDLQESANTLLLKSRGIQVTLGHDPAFVLACRPTLVASSAIAASNPELLAAQGAGLDIFHRSDLLAHLLSARKAITVAGSHGKTTTAAMAAFLLHGLGYDPEAVIGGTFGGGFPGGFLATCALTGQGAHLVAEADESDGSFLKYRPHIAVITNIGADHLDYYQDEAGILAAFKAYLTHIQPGGLAIIGKTSPLSCALAEASSPHPVITFGFTPANDLAVSAISLEHAYSHFTLQVSGRSSPLAVKLKAVGAHNIANACGALALVYSLGGDLSEAAALLASYPGVARRLSLLYTSDHLTLIDDYAHNPDKIQAAITAVRAAYQDSHLVVVFQPHRYSRLRTMGAAFVAAFSSADAVICLPVYGAGEAHDPSLTNSRLAAEIMAASQVPAQAAADFSAASLAVAKTIGANTVILTLGAGDVTTFAQKLAEKLRYEDTKQKSPQSP